MKNSNNCGLFVDFPNSASGKEPACQCRRHKRRGSGRFPWKQAWQPTPVFLPRESPWIEEPVGYSPRGCKESDMTEVTKHI